MSSGQLTGNSNDGDLQGYASNTSGQNQFPTYQTRARSNTASNLIFSDLCEKHGDRLIAYDINTGEIICNRCIYGRDQTNFQFTSTVAKRVYLSEKKK